ncbi:MAG: TIGR02646 family protein [Chloroflexi bacterium]|nr:TIGR02646 family protein [Chloroflexota bacterium]
MKPIRTLPNCPQGLSEYLNQGGDPTNWERFYDDDRESYRELRNALVETQHGLCGYCESALQDFGTQVEHVVPKNVQTGDPARAPDYTNLIACCIGEAGKRSESCGQAKGEVNDPNFIDPRTLPALLSLLCVLPDGRIVADQIACKATGINLHHVERTIDILGLKVERLRLDRENRWNNLKETWGALFHDVEVIQAAARQELLPGDDGTLSGFFTAARSYFGPLAERILAEPPQSWI